MAETDTNGSNGVTAITPEENGFPALGTSVAKPEVEETANGESNGSSGKMSTAEAWMKEDGPSGTDANEENGNARANGPRVDISSGEAFPALGTAPARKGPAPKWGPGTSPAPVKGTTTTGPAWKPAVMLNTIGQTSFELLHSNKRPVGELRKPLGEIVKDVMVKTNTKIESNNRGNATGFLVTGSENDRERARKEILRELTVKGTEKLTIPAAVRPHIIGKGGKIIGELQTKTFTNIKVPPAQPGTGPVDEYDESTIEIAIEGESEGRADARRMIMAIVSERGVKVTRRIECNGEYYHYIQGPFSRHVEGYEKTVDKVIVPDYFFSSAKDNFDPPSAPITIIGEKVAAEEVQAKIQEKVNQLRSQNWVRTIMDVPKEKHRFFTNNKARAIHEILQETGCTIILPTQDVGKLIVLGTAASLAKGLEATQKKADEFQSKTLDICKGFLNVPTGAKVHARDVTHYLSKNKAIHDVEKECDVQVAFPPAEILYALEKGCPVTIIGKQKANVEKATTKLMAIFGVYKPAYLAYVEVEPLHHKHIVGKDGKGVRRITEKTSVELSFPADPEDRSIVLVYEGQSQDSTEIAAALEEAQGLVEDAVKGLINIVPETLKVPQEYHSKIRGENNTTLNALNPSSISVYLGAPKARPGKPAPAADADVENTITLRGPPSNVEATKKKILDFVNDIKEGKDERVTITFDYEKEYSGNLIGTKGANINKLREEYGVDINLNEGKGEIKGLQVTVDAAKRKLKQQIEELKDKAVLRVKVPQKFHSVIIGAEGATVKRLEEKYHVRITFPKNGRGDASPSDADGPAPGKQQAPDEIIVRGSKKEAEEVRQEITELFKYEQENSYTETITVTSRAQNYMFRNASKDIKHLRDTSTARINIPPQDKEADPEAIMEIKIRGQKEEVDHAKAVLSKIAKTAGETARRTINVDKKFHRSLIGPGGQALKDIVVKAGGPEDRAALARMVRFPDQDATSTEITVEGKSSVVDNIIAAIEKIIAEKENQVTETVDVAPEKHRKLIGREGSVRKELEAKFNVSIDIPRQRQGQQSQTGVKVVGSPEAVAQAKEYILEMVKEPEGETIEVPRRLHHVVTDQGQFIRQLKRDFDVTIDHNGIPRPPRLADPKPGNAKDLPLITDDSAEGDEKISWEVVEAATSDDESTYPWVIIGNPENIAKAKVAIEKAVETAEKQSSIGLLTLPDPTKYRFVVGPGGSQVDKIRRETGCRITVPRNQASGEAIVLHGSKEGLEKAKEMILTVVKNGGGERSPRPSRGGRRG